MNQIPRRQFLKLAGLGSLALSLPHCRTRPTSASKPNVLFISLDDLNDWIEPLGGHPQAKTPNLARFAGQAVNFTNSYCASPACNPSRTALMTGLSPHRSGVYSNYQDWREVITGHKTIGQHFRENGYYSTGAGKIFHYHMIDTNCWDDYWPSLTNNMPKEYMPQQSGESSEGGPNTISMPEFEDM